MEETICVFGDSSTWGAWDEKGGWVNRLKYYLSLTEENYANVYGLGVNGDTTRRLLKRFDTEAKARKPTKIIFEIGSNDATLMKSKNELIVPITEFEENIKLLIEKAKQYTDKITFIGYFKINENKTTPVYWDSDLYYTNEKTQAYLEKLKEILQDKNIPIIELNDMTPEDLHEDGLHLNTQGHEKIFEKVKKEI